MAILLLKIFCSRQYRFLYSKFFAYLYKMVVNNPHLPKHRAGYYINTANMDIHFGIYNKNKGILNNSISIASFFDSHNNEIDIAHHINNMDNGAHIYFENWIDRKDFFATKQQAEHALKTRTK